MKFPLCLIDICMYGIAGQGRGEAEEANLLTCQINCCVIYAGAGVGVGRGCGLGGGIC